MPDGEEAEQEERDEQVARALMDPPSVSVRTVSLRVSARSAQ